MSFTPVSWLADHLSRVRVGGREIRERAPTGHVPAPVLKAGFWLVVVVLFLDEFLLLAAVVGGPLAFVLLLGFALTVVVARRTDRGRRAKRRVSSRVKGSVRSGSRAGYRTRQKRK